MLDLSSNLGTGGFRTGAGERWRAEQRKLAADQAAQVRMQAQALSQFNALSAQNNATQANQFQGLAFNNPNKKRKPTILSGQQDRPNVLVGAGQEALIGQRSVLGG